MVTSNDFTCLLVVSRRRERRGEEYLIFSSNTACIYHLSLGFRRTISKSTFCTRHTHMSSRCRLSGRKICAGVLHVAAIYTKRGRRRVYSALFLQSFSEGHLIRHCVFFLLRLNRCTYGTIECRPGGSRFSDRLRSRLFLRLRCVRVYVYKCVLVLFFSSFLLSYFYNR